MHQGFLCIAFVLVFSCLSGILLFGQAETIFIWASAQPAVVVVFPPFAIGAFIGDPIDKIAGSDAKHQN